MLSGCSQQVRFTPHRAYPVGIRLSGRLPLDRPRSRHHAHTHLSAAHHRRGSKRRVSERQLTVIGLSMSAFRRWIRRVGRRNPTQSRPSGLSKAALRSDRLLIGSTSPKQPFVAASSRPGAVIRSVGKSTCGRPVSKCSRHRTTGALARPLAWVCCPNLSYLN